MAKGHAFMSGGRCEMCAHACFFPPLVPLFVYEKAPQLDQWSWLRKSVSTVRLVC